MAQGITFNLIWISLWIAAIGFWISSKDISRMTAIFVAWVKVSIPFVYFSFFYNGTWNLLDDLTYAEHGKQLLELGYNPLTVLVDPKGLLQLMVMNSGYHILYSWWNLLAQYLFGQYYYSAVFLNVGLTFISGYLLYRLAQLFGYSKNYSKGLLIFFLLHWDLLAWSSFVNVKDILVMSLTLLNIYYIIRWLKKRTYKNLLPILAVTFLFFFIRFYIPILVVIVTFAWALIKKKGRFKYQMIILCLIGTVGIVHFLGLRSLLYSIQMLTLSPVSIAIGTIRQSLTPQPWSIVPEYTYLLIPSILHVVFYLPAVVGSWLLWRRGPKEISFLLMYLGMVILLGAGAEMLQDPRRRVQVIFIIVWVQFHFLWVTARLWRKSHSPKQSIKVAYFSKTR